MPTFVNQDRIYVGGRPTTGWHRGDKITSSDEVKVGDMLIGVSHQFSAENLYIVIDPGWPLIGKGFYAQYADPDKTPIGGLGNQTQFCRVHEFELASPQGEWFKAYRVLSQEDHLKDAYEGSGRRKTMTFLQWVKDAAEDDRHTMQDAAKEYLEQRREMRLAARK